MRKIKKILMTLTVLVTLSSTDAVARGTKADKDMKKITKTELLIARNEKNLAGLAEKKLSKTLLKSETKKFTKRIESYKRKLKGYKEDFEQHGGEAKLTTKKKK